MIRKTENALSEKIDALERQNIKHIDIPPIPLMDLSKYGAYLPFGEKCIHFIVDASDYTWFEISSLCEVFNVKPDIFEPKTEIFYLTDSPNDEKSFMNEIDIFLTPLVDKSEFTDWYSNYAVPRITSFIVNRTDYNENKYRRILNLEFEIVRKALKDNIEKLREQETLNVKV
ncbi:hypothetical protein AVEN_147472-1 [Araneus ventricosus]|uniref:Uncharacterized protein n=1 Tax=Araneus ventricosus TaxID=182803 RepID=A0A4Y2MVD9_ARAVE|nr:hypothetical protein AVEN_147472-1 [Araneus ventricosus]